MDPSSYLYMCTVAEFEQMLHFGLEWLGNVCESTFDGTKMCKQYTQALFVKKKSHSCKNYLCIISTRWISGPEERVLLSGLEDFF